jgi:hypothetical protein
VLCDDSRNDSHSKWKLSRDQRSTALGGGGGESLQQEMFSSSFLSPSSTTTELCDCVIVFVISLIDLMAGL